MKRRPGCPANLLLEGGAASWAGSLPENRQDANEVALGGARGPTLGFKPASFGGKGTSPPWVRGRQHSPAVAAGPTCVEAPQSECKRASASHAPALTCFAGAHTQLCYVQVTGSVSSHSKRMDQGRGPDRSSRRGGWRQHWEQSCSVDLRGPSRRWGRTKRLATCNFCPRAIQQMG